VVDGFHGDQDFLHKLFNFKSHLVAKHIRDVLNSIVFATAPCQATLSAGSWHSTRRKCCPWCEVGTANVPGSVSLAPNMFFRVKPINRMRMEITGIAACAGSDFCGRG